jgi:hypothetical protein
VPTVDFYAIELPSGNQAQVIMTMTAGEAVIASGLAVLIAISAFDLVRRMAHGAKTK